MMAAVLYTIPPSPAVRAVLITAKALDLDLEQRPIDIAAREHLQPEFLRINPQHSVPTLVENDGFVIWDSHAIITYLVSKYAKDDALYPKDLKKRAIVDQRLYFEIGVVFARLRKIVDPILHGTQKHLTKEDIDGIKEIYAFMEAFLNGWKWIAGDCVTVADYSLVTSISNLAVLHAIDGKKFPKVTEWFKNCQALPEYEANEPGLEVFADIIKNKMH